MTGARLGRDAKFYLNTGTYGSPTWAAIDQISDLTVAAPWDEAPADTRESVVGMTLNTTMRLQVSGKVKFVNDATNLTTILDAADSRAPLDIMVHNGASDGSHGIRGFRFDAQVSLPNEDQGLGVAIFDEVLFKPTPSANTPKKAVVATNAPVFTAI